MALPITDLDFDNILLNFKNYLKSQDKFKDYNFEGSAISELLKLLSYNTFYNSFYTNTIASEMFLDSASERSSIVSRAKSLGYIPTSSKSSYVYVDLEAHITKVYGVPFPTSTSDFISLLPYSTFTSAVNEVSYNFITTELNSLYFVEDAGDYFVYKKPNVRIVEGKPLNYSFNVQNEYEEYLIPNKNVDVDSISVRVYDSSTSLTYETFSRVDFMINTIDSTSKVFWVYEGMDGKYYLQFGNDVFGKKLTIGNVVYVEYITTSGSSANGAKNFYVGNYTYSDTSLIEYDALTITTSNYTILSIDNPSSGSSDFSNTSIVVGETSGTIASFYSFDVYNSILKLYGANGAFTFGETIHEEFSIGANTIFGANGIITSIKTETSLSTGGSDIESIYDIKLNAPKLYASQNRLITASDYEAIVKHNYPYVDSVVCWGGEEETPQTLGNVYLAIKPKSRETLDTWEKDYILTNIIDDKKVISMNVNIIDPDYIYIYPIVNVKYNADATASTTQEGVETAVKNIINLFDIVNLNTFKNTFYYSPFLTTIDNSNEFIYGNETEIRLVKIIYPLLNVPYTANNEKILIYSAPISTDYDDVEILYSSTFTCNVGSVTKGGCSFVITPSNNQILSVANTTSTVIDNAGIIDYENGIITISNTNIISTDLYDSANNSIIEMYVTPASNDLTCGKNQILKIHNNISVTAIPTRSKK